MAELNGINHLSVACSSSGKATTETRAAFSFTRIDTIDPADHLEERRGGGGPGERCIVGGNKMHTLAASKKRRQQGGGFTEANQYFRVMWRAEQGNTFSCIKKENLSCSVHRTRLNGETS